MLYIHGMGHFHPENVIDNKFLENLDIGTENDWIIERVGIKTRRTGLPLHYIVETKNADPTKAAEVMKYSDAQTGSYAAKMALERAGLNASDIGMVIAGGCALQYSSPATACIVAAELGIQAFSFDLNSACTTFGAQMDFVNNMKLESLPEYVLLLNIDNITRVADYSDRTSAVLFGDASVAAIVSASRPSRMRITAGMTRSDPSNWTKLITPSGGHFVQDGRAVQAFAIRKTVWTARQLKEHVKGEWKDVYFISHQANLLMLQNVCQRLQISEDRHLYNVETFGNCGSAGAPSVLSQNWDRFKDGDEILLVVVGGGLSWAGLHIQVCES